VKKGALDGLSLRVGAKNIFDKQPPIIDSGYLGSLYVPYGRYWYTQIGFKF
jgi:outer membrane receptor protein involved in Fe transport